MDKLLQVIREQNIEAEKIKPDETKKELTLKEKEDNFLDYLGLDRDDLSDDGSDLEELKELGGFNE